MGKLGEDMHINDYVMFSRQLAAPLIMHKALKQHYVTLTATYCLEKRNLTMQYIAQNSNFSKIGSYFTETMPAGFPSDVLRVLCLLF